MRALPLQVKCRLERQSIEHRYGGNIAICAILPDGERHCDIVAAAAADGGRRDGKAKEPEMTTSAVAAALDAALDALMIDGATLGERLVRYADFLRERNRPFAEAVDRLIARLAAVDAGSSAPKAGEEMPDFLLPDEAGRLTSLGELVESGPAVLAFRRGHWCPYCQLATEALARVEPQVVARGARIAVVSPERSSFTRELKCRAGATFPFLSDIDNGYALTLGLAISVGEEMREFMAQRGRDLAEYQGNAAWLLPIPATFVIDRQRTIVMRHVDADYRRRAAIDAILAALDQAAG